MFFLTLNHSTREERCKRIPSSPLFEAQYVIAVRNMQSCLQLENLGKDASGCVCVCGGGAQA